MLLGGTTTVLLLGGTTTLTSLGCDEPPPLVELHAVRASMVRTRKTGMIFLGVIEYLSFVLSLKYLYVMRFNPTYTRIIMMTRKCSTADLQLIRAQNSVKCEPNQFQTRAAIHNTFIPTQNL